MSHLREEIREYRVLIKQLAFDNNKNISSNIGVTNFPLVKSVEEIDNLESELNDEANFRKMVGIIMVIFSLSPRV